MKTIDMEQLANVTGGEYHDVMNYAEGTPGRVWQDRGGWVGRQLGSDFVRKAGETVGATAYWRLRDFPVGKPPPGSLGAGRQQER